MLRGVAAARLSFLEALTECHHAADSQAHHEQQKKTPPQACMLGKLPAVHIPKREGEQDHESVEHVLRSGTLVLLVEVDTRQHLHHHGRDRGSRHPGEPARYFPAGNGVADPEQPGRAGQPDGYPTERGVERGHRRQANRLPVKCALVSLCPMARVAITGARLFDGSGAEPLEEQTIIWEAAEISWVGPDDEAPIGDSLAIPAEGGTVLPGLIDSHVHISLSPTPSGVDDVAEEPVSRTVIRAAHAASVLLRAGITTARDVGSREGVAIDIAAAQREGDLQGARIIAAGRGITPKGGHGQTIGVEVQGAGEVAGAVTEEIERGADLIKIFPTGGVLGPGTHGYDIVMSADEVLAAVETAHEMGVLVAGHVHGPEGIELVLDAGIDTIEHGTAATADQAVRMMEEEVALIPTLVPIKAILQREFELPRDLLKRAAKVDEVAAASTATAIETGVMVLPGTDAGTPFNPPGQLVDEMTLLRDLGMTNAGVIAAATSVAASVFGWDELGVLEAGQVADLLLVEGDPLEDLGTLAWPLTIVQNGVVI